MFLNDFFGKRKYLIEIIILSLFIALAINIISQSISEIIVLNPICYLSLGIFICVISVSYFLNRLLSNRVMNLQFEGFFIFNKENNKIIDIYRYDFSSMLKDCLKDAFAEDKALKSIWENEPLSVNEFFEESKSREIIQEASEYYALSKLSTHLEDYFNKDEFADDEELKEFERNELPEILLNNRFIELFSKPMDQRSHFLEEKYQNIDKESDIKINDTNHKIVWANIPTEDGHIIYEKFSLTLPKNSEIERINNQKIIVKMDLINLEIKIEFLGFSTILPKGFPEYYLDIDLANFIDNYIVFNVVFQFRVNFRLYSLFTTRGRNYYNWIDSYLNKMKKQIARKDFFKEIGWDTVLTLLHCQKGEKKKSQEKK